MAACCHSGSDYAIDGVGLIYVHADWEITNHVSDKAGTVFPLVGMTGDPDINHLNALMVLLANPKSIVIVGLDGIPRTLGNVIEPTHFKVHDGVMFDLMAQGPGLMINTVALQNAMRKVISEVVSHLEASILGCDDLFTRYIMGVQVASLFKFPIVDINGGVEYKHFYGYVFETEMSRSEISLLARSVSHEGATVPNSNKILDFETSRLLLSSCAATHTSAVKNGWAPNNHADTGKGLIQQLLVDAYFRTLLKHNGFGIFRGDPVFYYYPKIEAVARLGVKVTFEWLSFSFPVEDFNLSMLLFNVISALCPRADRLLVTLIARGRTDYRAQYSEASRMVLSIGGDPINEFSNRVVNPFFANIMLKDVNISAVYVEITKVAWYDSVSRVRSLMMASNELNDAPTSLAVWANKLDDIIRKADSASIMGPAPGEGGKPGVAYV